MSATTGIQQIGSVRHFYKNKNILLTGCTGFLGSAIVEKMLRSFPDIGKLYLIARTKPGQNLYQRSQEYFKDEVFNRMKRENPSFLSKVEWIEGDLNKPKLGISHRDADKIKDVVNMVWHNGANIRFNDPLKITLQTNCKSTLDLLDITKEIENLDCFMYMSTTYSNVNLITSRIEERVYPHPIEPRTLLKRAETEDLRDVPIAPWFNTYSYSKNVSENIVKEYNNYFPAGVFRPAVIFSSHKEPFEYWLKSVAGFGGLIQLVHRGHMRVLYSHLDALANIVPVDMTTNAFIANSYDVALRKSPFTPVMNYSANNHSSNWGTVMQYSLTNVADNAKYGLTPNPSCILTNSRARYNVLRFFHEYLPACYNDLISLIKLQKRTHLRANSNLNALVNALECFMETPYNWDNANAERLYEQLSKEDRKLLPFNIHDINWKTYYSKVIIESQKVYHKAK